MTEFEKLCHALNVAHTNAFGANAALKRLEAALLDARKASILADSVLENAKDDVLRAVGEPVDHDHYTRGIE